MFSVGFLPLPQEAPLGVRKLSPFKVGAEKIGAFQVRVTEIRMVEL